MRYRINRDKAEGVDMEKRQERSLKKPAKKVQKQPSKKAIESVQSVAVALFFLSALFLYPFNLCIANATPSFCVTVKTKCGGREE